MYSQINVRIDSVTKANVEKTLDKIGLNMSSAINIFLKAVEREKRIPFELTAEEKDSFYSEANQKYLKDLLRKVDEGKVKFEKHELIEV